MPRETVFSKICNRTYTHGLPDWYNSTKWPAKIVWTLILLGAGAAIGWYSYQMISAFLQHQTVTQISEVRVAQMEFPNLTICFSARFNKTFVTQNVSLPPAMAIPTGYDETSIRNEFFRYFATLAYQSLAFDAKITTYLRSMYEYNFDRGSNSKAYDILEFLRAAAFRCPITFTVAWFATKSVAICDVSRMVLTDWGMCYSMKLPNRDRTDLGPTMQITTGSNWGLIMRVAVEKEFIMKVKPDDDLAVRVQLSGYAEPNDKNVVFLLPNHRGDVRLNPTRRVIDPTIQTCVQQGTSSLANHETYTKGLCENECVRNFSMSACSCAPAGYLARVPSESVCSPQKMLDCVLPLIRAAKRDRKHAIRQCYAEQCPEFCETWDYAPSTTFTQTIAKNITAYSLDRIIPSSPGRLVAVASIYFSQMHFMNIEQQPLMKLEEFICNLGGTWGLWTGVSVVAFVQFCYIALCGAWEPDDDVEDSDEVRDVAIVKKKKPSMVQEIATVDKSHQGVVNQVEEVAGREKTD